MCGHWIERGGCYECKHTLGDLVYAYSIQFEHACTLYIYIATRLSIGNACVNVPSALMLAMEPIIVLISIPSNIVMGCVVLGKQMDVYVSPSDCANTILFVGMDAHFRTIQIHFTRRTKYIQTINRTSIVVHCGASCNVQSFNLTSYIGTKTFNPIFTILHKITSLCCCNSGTFPQRNPTRPTLFETTLRYFNIGPTPCTTQTNPMKIRHRKYPGSSILTFCLPCT